MSPPLGLLCCSAHKYIPTLVVHCQQEFAIHKEVAWREPPRFILRPGSKNIVPDGTCSIERDFCRLRLNDITPEDRSRPGAGKWGVGVCRQEVGESGSGDTGDSSVAIFGG